MAERTGANRGFHLARAHPDRSWYLRRTSRISSNSARGSQESAAPSVLGGQDIFRLVLRDGATQVVISPRNIGPVCGKVLCNEFLVFPTKDRLCIRFAAQNLCCVPHDGKDNRAGRVCKCL